MRSCTKPSASNVCHNSANHIPSTIATTGLDRTGLCLELMLSTCTLLAIGVEIFSNKHSVRFPNRVGRISLDGIMDAVDWEGELIT